MAMAELDRPNSRRQRATEFWIYFSIIFPLCLVVALMSRLLPPAKRPFLTRRGSVFSDAKAAAYTVLPFVFKA